MNDDRDPLVERHRRQFHQRGRLERREGPRRVVDAGEATFSGMTSGGVLTVSDGKHTTHITLNGNYLNATFVASNHSGHGVDVVAEKAGNLPALAHAFVEAMAGFASPVGQAFHADGASLMHEVLLTSPRVAIA